MNMDTGERLVERWPVGTFIDRWRVEYGDGDVVRLQYLRVPLDEVPADYRVTGVERYWAFKRFRGQLLEASGWLPVGAAGDPTGDGDRVTEAGAWEELERWLSVQEQTHAADLARTQALLDRVRHRHRLALGV